MDSRLFCIIAGCTARNRCTSILETPPVPPTEMQRRVFFFDNKKFFVPTADECMALACFTKPVHAIGGDEFPRMGICWRMLSFF